MPSSGSADEVIYGDRCDGAAVHDKVVRVLDGDTVEISSGPKVRFLLVDTPEISHSQSEVPECYGDEARNFTSAHLLGQWIDLTYDEVCTDRYGRLLAYVTHTTYESVVFNELLLSEGYATVLYIPPNGADWVDHYRELEYLAKNSGVGVHGVCAKFNP